MLGEGRPLAKRAWLLIFVKCTQWGKQVAALNVRARHAQQGPREVPCGAHGHLKPGTELGNPRHVRRRGRDLTAHFLQSLDATLTMKRVKEASSGTSPPPAHPALVTTHLFLGFTFPGREPQTSPQLLGLSTSLCKTGAIYFS